MTLCVERRDGALCLVGYPSLTDPSCIILARFVNEDTVKLYKAATAISLVAAQERGRMSL